MNTAVLLAIAATATVLAIYCARGVHLAARQLRAPLADRLPQYRHTPDWILRVCGALYAVAAAGLSFSGVGLLILVLA
jgi:hypothetical protein